MVRYKTKEGRAEENAALIRAVFEELRTRAPGGLRYASYRLPDGVSFVHIAKVDSAGENPLTSLPAFKIFQSEINNARDWEGVRALVGDDCRLDLVSKSQRRGKQVRMYFERYEKENVALRVVRLEGALALAAYVAGAACPQYFMLLEFDAGHVASIRDFRYVPYIAEEAEFELVQP